MTIGITTVIRSVELLEDSVVKGPKALQKKRFTC
jgi:hypothetical protein